MNNLKKNIYKTLNTISKLYPRSKNLFIFIGWHRSKNGEVFADNTKYLFLYLNENVKNIKPIWIAKSRVLARELRSMGYQSYYENSLLGSLSMLKAKYFIIDAFLQPVNYKFSGGAKIIQLLHGKGLKKKGYSEKPLQKNDYIFATSPFTLSLLGKEFVQDAKTFVTGYSRNDVFFENIKGSILKEEEKIINLIKERKNSGSKVALYAPTFRRGEADFSFEKNLDLEKLNNLGRESNIIFLLSLHTKYRSKKDFSVHENLIFMPDIDIYPVLPLVDLLITDYSSSFADFVLLDNPIIFYVYDLEKYNQKEGLVENYKDLMPGEFIYKFDDLIKEIKETLLDNKDLYKEKRKKILDLYHEFKDGKSSERIWHTISKLI